VKPVVKRTNKARDMAAALYKSDYRLSAVGCRDVRFDELVSVFEALLSADDPVTTLGRLYKYHPNTIEMSREQSELTCPSYDRSSCRCYLPDNPGCWMVEARKDKRDSPEYKEWRNKVFARDDYTCVDCGQRGGEINAHHIQEYAKHPELRISVDNGITLCCVCHKKRHRVSAESE
jgi:hypothetical protein